MYLINIPALQDNYIWLLCDKKTKECVVIDPGDAKPVLKYITMNKLSLNSILLTHHHQDHVGGVFELLKKFFVPVYGPYETRNQGTNRIVRNGCYLTLLNTRFKVFDLPGHTSNHIGFYCKPWMFCGDTMFSAGCGKIFESTAQEMYKSFEKINQLPENTLIYSAHEYTLSNIKFVESLFPQDKIILNFKCYIEKLRRNNCPSLPTALYIERKINPFLRCNDSYFQKKLQFFSKKGEEWKIFKYLREKKDLFKI